MENDYTKHIKPYLNELEPLDAIATDADTLISKFDAKAVIFDIYGTLLISASGDVDQAEYNGQMVRKALLASSFNILKDNNKAYDTLFEQFKTCLDQHLTKGREEGRPHPEVDIISVWNNTLAWAEEQGIIESTPESDVYLYTFVFELQTNKVWPMPELKEVIKGIQLKNLPLGIVSNAQFYTPVIMNFFLNDAYKGGRSIAPFDDEISIFSFEELRGKPDTELFKKLAPNLAKIGIKPEEALFVGNDMLKDVYTASEAGFKTVLFAGDERSYRLRTDDERTAKLKPDFVITKLTQLLDIIN